MSTWWRAVCVALFVLGATSRLEAATHRDGCPAFEPVRPHMFGVNSLHDSALAPSHAGISSRAVHLTQTSDNATVGAVYLTKLQVQFTGRGTPASPGSRPSQHGISLFLSTDWIESAHEDRLSNSVAFLSYRNARLVLADAVRIGFTTRIGIGIAFTEHEEGREGNQFAGAIPFDMTTYGFDRPITVGIEARAEMVGCYSPFLHLKVDFTAWRAATSDGPRDAQDVIAALPISLAAGGYARPNLGFAATASFQYVRPQKGIFPKHVTRVEAMLQPVVGPITLDLFVAGTSGSLTGGEAGARLRYWW